MVSLDEPFGDRSWADLRRAVTQRLRRKWPGMSSHDIEDAVSWAVCDLIGYWFGLPSVERITDPGQRFAYAVKRAYWTGCEALARNDAMRSAERADAPVGHRSHVAHDARVRGQLAAALVDLVDELPDEEALVVRAIYDEGRAMHGFAGEMSTYPKRIQRLHARALRRLNTLLLFREPEAYAAYLSEVIRVEEACVLAA